MPTLPHVAACGADVDVGFRHAARDAHVAHALELHVEVGIADLVAVSLPVVVGVVGQVVAPDEALSDHPPLLLRAALDDLHVAVPACLDAGEERVFQDVMDCVTALNYNVSNLATSTDNVLLLRLNQS